VSRLWSVRFNEERRDAEDDLPREEEVFVVIEAESREDAARLTGLDKAAMKPASNGDLIAWDEQTDEPLTRREAILLFNLAGTAQRRTARKYERAVEKGRPGVSDAERWRARKLVLIRAKLTAQYGLTEEGT
jgi:hypothetical protein